MLTFKTFSTCVQIIHGDVYSFYSVKLYTKESLCSISNYFMQPPTTFHARPHPYIELQLTAKPNHTHAMQVLELEQPLL